jgi:hypothetical protein
MTSNDKKSGMTRPGLACISSDERRREEKRSNATTQQ